MQVIHLLLAAGVSANERGCTIATQSAELYSCPASPIFVTRSAVRDSAHAGHSDIVLPAILILIESESGFVHHNTTRIVG